MTMVSYHTSNREKKSDFLFLLIISVIIDNPCYFFIQLSFNSVILYF